MWELGTQKRERDDDEIPLRETSKNVKTCFSESFRTVQHGTSQRGRGNLHLASCMIFFVVGGFWRGEIVGLDFPRPGAT